MYKLYQLSIQFIIPSQDGTTKTLTKASITLNDCLACSGCITSAESVLIGQQSNVEFLKICDGIRDGCEYRLYDNMVVSISHQPVLSFAAKFKIPPLEARSKLSGLFRKLGASYVYDLTLATEMSLLECGRDLVERFRTGSSNRSKLPVIASACPGQWHARKHSNNEINSFSDNLTTTVT